MTDKPDRITRWFLIDVKEWIVEGLPFSTEEHGAAMRLLIAEAQGKPITTEKEIAAALRITPVRWRKIGPWVFSLILRWRPHMEYHERVGRESLSEATRRLVLERDGAVCAYCGDTEGPFHIDHVEPVAKGGTNHPDNLCVACIPCNLSKSDKLLSEWRPDLAPN